MKKPRLWMTLTGLALLLAFALFVPLPYRVMSTCEIQAQDAAPVYVDVSGRLEKLFVQAGEKVRAGQPLAQLSDHDLEIEIGRLETLRNQYQARLSALERRRSADAEAANELPALRELQTVVQQLAEKKRDQERLLLLAPCDGVVLPPPWRTISEDKDAPLPEWSGTPLEPRNLGAFLKEGELFCTIADPQKMEAILIIDQGDIDFVQPGQSVRIKLDDMFWKTFRGTIEEVAKREVEAASPRLAGKAGGELATKTDPKTGIEKPISTVYQARVPLPDPDNLLIPGLRGRAKIHVDSKHWLTIGQRVWRFVTRTFNFRM